MNSDSLDNNVRDSQPGDKMDMDGYVLVVDDNPQVSGLIVRQLRSAGIESLHVASGEAALELVDKGVLPSLILMDVIMPGLGGLEVCEKLKASGRTKWIPVIFITGSGEVEDETRCFDVGGLDFILKPVKPRLVTARVKAHLSLYRHNRSLETLVSRRTSELEEAFNKLKSASIDTILRLSRAADFKDDDTGVHVIRMSNYASAVALQMTGDREFSQNLLWAAPMHDIGKIGIPDRILLKPGKLDSDEIEFMKKHCEMGSAILSGSDSEIIKMAEVVASTHHEKWDGSGYPAGLNREQIPLSGRITAVADVFDALTSKRPYKEPFPIDRAFSIIQEGRGNHFDPAAVDAFFEVESSILSIKKKHQDGSVLPFSLIPPAPPVPSA